MDQLNLKRVIETSDQLQRTLRKLIIYDQGGHAETLVASSARMAGTMLLRYLPLVVVRAEPKEVLGKHSPVLVQTLLATLRQLGHGEIDERRLTGSRASTALSRLSLIETQEILDPWYRQTAESGRLSLFEVAVSAAMSTALLIHDCRETLDLYTGCAIATHGFVEPMETSAARTITAT